MGNIISYGKDISACSNLRWLFFGVWRNWVINWYRHNQSFSWIYTHMQEILSRMILFSRKHKMSNWVLTRHTPKRALFHRDLTLMTPSGYYSTTIIQNMLHYFKGRAPGTSVQWWFPGSRGLHAHITTGVVINKGVGLSGQYPYLLS